MDRRRFFGALVGAVLAPLACKAAPLSIYDEMLAVDYNHWGQQVTTQDRILAFQKYQAERDKSDPTKWTITAHYGQQGNR